MTILDEKLLHGKKYHKTSHYLAANEILDRRGIIMCICGEISNCDAMHLIVISSGSSGRVRGGAEKHEIYAAAFGGHLFYDLFSQGRGGAMAPLAPPGSATGN